MGACLPPCTSVLHGWQDINFCWAYPLRFEDCLLLQHDLNYPGWYNSQILLNLRQGAKDIIGLEKVDSMFQNIIKWIWDDHSTPRNKEVICLYSSDHIHAFMSELLPCVFDWTSSLKRIPWEMIPAHRGWVLMGATWLRTSCQKEVSWFFWHEAGSVIVNRKQTELLNIYIRHP